jgi:hypothetical protein
MLPIICNNLQQFATRITSTTGPMIPVSEQRLHEQRGGRHLDTTAAVRGLLG